MNATVIPYNTFPRVMLRFVVLALVVEAISRFNPRAGDMAVAIILLSVIFSNRAGFEQFSRFVRFEIGG